MTSLLFINPSSMICSLNLKKYSLKIKNFINFASTLKRVIKLIKTIDMGKGDKKTRRGKIILGSYGVRRPRKKNNKPEIKPVKEVMIKEPKDKKPLKEKKEPKEATAAKVVKEAKEVKEGKEVKVVKEVIPAVNVKETKNIKEKAQTKAPKAAKEKKEIKEDKAGKEAKPKKEKKS